VENSAKNRDNGNRVANTGRTSVNCNLVYQTKILFCGGGNLSLSALIGLPVYEDVNDVQLGEEFHASLGLQWQRRF